MIAQELLEALNKALNETNLDQVAVWALAKYLQAAWRDTPGKNIRPFDLGQVLSDFFVDLSQHRLPEKITKQTPQTESILMNFFGAAEGSKSHFWAQCIQIWSVTLEPYPAYARDIQQYLDMLLHASLQTKRSDSGAAPGKPPVESFNKSPEAHGSAPIVGGTVPEAPAAPPARPSPVAIQPPVAPPTPVATGPLAASGSIEKPDQADVSVSTGNETGSAAPAQGPAPKYELETKPLTRNAYLVLQGTRVIPLDRALIKIGRQLDNHIILEDPRVSRSHAQIKLINDRFVIFDLNSTGGTFVNGQPASQSVLYPGDVVSLAGVVFIFSQEMPARPGDMKIIELGSPFAADRPTAVIHKEEIKPPKKTGPKGLPDLPKTGPLKGL